MAASFSFVRVVWFGFRFYLLGFIWWWFVDWLWWFVDWYSEVAYYSFRMLM